MNDKIFIDTNILIYSIDNSDGLKTALIQENAFHKYLDSDSD